MGFKTDDEEWIMGWEVAKVVIHGGTFMLEDEKLKPKFWDCDDVTDVVEIIVTGLKFEETIVEATADILLAFSITGVPEASL